MNGRVIKTIRGDRFAVLESTRFDDPLRVEHDDPAMRGSFVEASLNLALSIRSVRVEIREALPRWLRWFVPEPEKFWEVAEWPE